MTRFLVLVFAGLAALVGLGFVLFGDVPLSVFVSIGIGALSLLWLLLLLTVPWNVYFQARALLVEIRTSRERGIAVSPERDAEARRIAARMRAVAIGGHLGTAGVIATVTYFAGGQIGYYFAGFYLLSTFFRPVGAWFRYVRERLATVLDEVKYPRHDIVELRSRVGDLEHDIEGIDHQVRYLRTNHDTLAAELATVDRRATERDHDLERSLAAHARQFEHSLSRLTDNQEVMAGLKAFLRMVRTSA